MHDTLQVIIHTKKEKNETTKEKKRKIKKESWDVSWVVLAKVSQITIV
jgi:hypothetical protein